MPLPIDFTVTFTELYRNLSPEDVAAVDRMLDELEARHDHPHTRAIIRVGEHSIFATPRISARRELYRITWTYDRRDSPTAIVCLTVARLKT